MSHKRKTTDSVQEQQQQKLLDLIKEANSNIRSNAENYKQVFVQQCKKVLDAVLTFYEQYRIEFSVKWKPNYPDYFYVTTKPIKFELFLDRDRLDNEMVSGLGQLFTQHNLLQERVRKYSDFVGIPVDFSRTHISNFVFSSRSDDDVKTRGNDSTFKFVSSTTIPSEITELEINSDFEGDLITIVNNYNCKYDARLTIRLEDWSDFTQKNLIEFLKIVGSFSNNHINNHKKNFFLKFFVVDSAAINLLDKTELKEIAASPIKVTHLQFVTIGHVDQSEIQSLLAFLGPLFQSEIFELQCAKRLSIDVTTLDQLKTVLEPLWGHQSVLGFSISPIGYEHVFDDNGVVNVDWDKKQFQRWMFANAKTLGSFCENDIFLKDFRDQVTPVLQFIESRTTELKSLYMIDYRTRMSIDSTKLTPDSTESNLDSTKLTLSPIEGFFSNSLCDNKNMLKEIRSMMFGKIVGD